MEPNPGGGEENVTFPEIGLNYFRGQRGIAFTVQGGAGECSQKGKDLPRAFLLLRDLGDAYSCYKVVEKESQLWH